METLAIRNATPDDSATLAGLMNIAGEGIPAWLWSNMAEPGEDVMAFGARRVARTEGGFSHVNAQVATVRGAIAGMLLGYRLPDPYDAGPMDELPAVVRPLIELESLAPGSWYINAIATDAAWRGQGIGSRLLALANQLARNSGASALSLIVAEENTRAQALYQRLGYRTVARRMIVPFPGCPHAGHWALMTRRVDP